MASIPGSRPSEKPAKARLTAYRQQLFDEGKLRDLLIDGYKYTLADAGKGPPVVLLHGLGGSLYDWRHILGGLAEDHRVLAIDLLGAGESDKPREGDYSIHAQARRVKGILDVLGIARAAFAGNSYGGAIALAFAQDWPERVDRLVLIDSLCYPENIPLYVYLCQVPAADEVAKVLPLEKLTRWVLRGSYQHSEKLSEGELSTYLKELEPLERRVTVIRTVRALLPGDTREFEARMKAIRTPALLLWGKADSTIPVELGRRLAKSIPEATLVELEAGHVPNQECPEEVLKRMRKFLSGLP